MTEATTTEAQPSATEEQPSVRFPWPPPPGEPVTEAAGRTWSQSVFQPAAFFRAMPRRHGLGAPLLYYLALGVVVEGIHLFWRFILGAPAFETMPGGELFQSVGAGTSPVTGFLLAPVYLSIALFLTAAVSHVVLLIVRGAAHGFRTTLAVFCFAYGPALFAVIPRIGVLIGGIWILVIAIIGLREAHETSGARAAAAVLGPALLALVVLFVTLLAMMAGILAQM